MQSTSQKLRPSKDTINLKFASIKHDFIKKYVQSGLSAQIDVFPKVTEIYQVYV